MRLMLMKKILRILGIILVELVLIGGFLFSCFVVVNTMVSIKYETETGDGCISLVTGNKLCVIKFLWTVAAVLFLVLSVGWIVYIQRKKNIGK